MLRRLLATGSIMAVLAAGAAVAWAVSGSTTGTVSVCAAATTPAQTVAVNGRPVTTLPGNSASRCATTTFTVPTITVTSQSTTAPTSTSTPTTTATTTAPTTTTTSSGSVAPPVPPTTDITNPAGVGDLVIGGPVQQHDYVSQGSYDSAVLLGPECAGSSFSRFHLVNAASLGSGPGYGRHALYAKAANVSVSDWYVRMNPSAPDIGSVFSIRYAGFQATRFDVAGLWFASLFDDDPNHTPGPVHFTDGKVQFASSSAILVDAQIVYSITIDSVDFRGPTDSLIHVDSGSAMPSSVVIHNSTMNGKPITLSMLNVPAGRVSIS